MTALNDGHHAAIGHFVYVVGVETHGRALSALVDSDINHGLLFMGIKLLNGQ